MNFNVKASHNKKLFKYVLIRLIFSSIISCLLLLGVYLLYGEMWIAIAFSMPLTLAICLYTSLLIARRTKNLIDIPLGKMLEYTHILKDASLALIEAAKTLDVKATSMNNAADLLDEVAITCEKMTESENLL